jgi:hypothetical protein
MTQFPLGDNLRGARRARVEGYAGTFGDGRLSWFLPNRRLTASAVAVSALASLLALAALVTPVVGLAPDGMHSGRANALSAMLGYHYGGVWLAICLVLLAGVLTVAAASWGGGPATRQRGNPILVGACGLASLAAVAAAASLLGHSAELAQQVLANAGPGVAPKGYAPPPEPWPYLATPGLALWTCLAAAIAALAPPVLLAVNAAGRRGVVTAGRVAAK